MPLLGKFAKLKKNRDGAFFGKIVGLRHLHYPKWNPTMRVFLGITEMILFWIFQDSYYMESLQIIDKFSSSHLIVFLNMAYIFFPLVNPNCLINFHITIF